MKFALFYEIPVARPWKPDSEHRAYKDVLEQAVLGDRVGFHAFWTVEHHFLEEFSHCSNPEVLYGAVAARTERIRIGYGVRLTPQPYNHPVRSAESAAALDLLSDGRVDFGTGRSSTRLELEGFGIDPNRTRAMWREAVERIIGCWTNDEYEFEGEFWSMLYSAMTTAIISSRRGRDKMVLIGAGSIRRFAIYVSCSIFPLSVMLKMM